MNKIFQFTVKFFSKLKTFFPSPLPVGMAEFDVWSQSIIDAYVLPDNDSTRFALATMILHAGSSEAYKPKRFFGLCVKKSMANQIAGGVMQDLKKKQEDRIKEEQFQQKAEVTAPVISDGPR